MLGVSHLFKPVFFRAVGGQFTNSAVTAVFILKFNNPSTPTQHSLTTPVHNIVENLGKTPEFMLSEPSNDPSWTMENKPQSGRVTRSFCHFFS